MLSTSYLRDLQFRLEACQWSNKLAKSKKEKIAAAKWRDELLEECERAQILEAKGWRTMGVITVIGLVLILLVVVIGAIT